MSKRATVPVNVDGQFVRFVTPNQRGREVACKVLPPKEDFRREARKVNGEWNAFQRKLTDEDRKGDPKLLRP